MAADSAKLPAGPASYWRLVPGDVNGFLGLVVDNLSVLALLAAVLIGAYGVPAPIVFGRMFPGTALGVLLGDLVYTWLAVRLARRTGRSEMEEHADPVNESEYLVAINPDCGLPRNEVRDKIRKEILSSVPGIPAFRAPSSF